MPCPNNHTVGPPFCPTCGGIVHLRRGPSVGVPYIPRAGEWPARDSGSRTGGERMGLTFNTFGGGSSMLDDDNDVQGAEPRRANTPTVLIMLSAAAVTFSYLWAYA